MIAFVKGWLLTLVLLSCIPLLVITGGAAAIITSKASSTAQNSYAKAANVVEQTIGSIRTVCHNFTKAILLLLLFLFLFLKRNPKEQFNDSRFA